MENKKSAPKTKENTIKSKNASIHANGRKPKTAASINSASVPISAVDTLKRQCVKSKAELQKQTSEQTERPENYAVDTVEDKAESAAYMAADAVKQSARYVKNSVRQYRTRQSMPHDMPVPDIMVREDVPQPPALNAPKTKELSEGVKAVAPEQKIKGRQQAAANAKQQMAVKAGIQNVEPMKIKTKTEYLKNKSVSNGHTYKLKSDVVYKSKSKMIKPKTLQEVRARQAEIRLNSVDKRNQAVRKYVQNKLKTKSAEIRGTDIQPISDIPTQAETPVSPKQKPTPQEQIKVKKTDIKTKNSYFHSHARNITDVKTKPLDSPRMVFKEKQLIKQKPQNMIKSASEKISHFKPDRKVRVSKTAKYTVKKSATRATAKTQKQVTKQAAKQAAKRAKQLAQRSAQMAKSTAKATVRITKVIVHAVVAAAKALISALAALGGWAVLLVVLIVVIIMAAIAASPFGIFFSEEANDAGSILLSQIIAEYNVELTQETENVEMSIEHTEVEVIDNRTDNNIVIAVFAAKLAGAEDDTAEDVVIFDDVKSERLKEYFRSANTVDYTVENTTVSEEETAVKLIITVNGKTKDELINEYGLTDKQREAVETLLEHGDVLTSSSHSLAITDADVQSIINGLPDSLPQKRKDVVKNAGSLVGKVNYFWGGYAEI